MQEQQELPGKTAAEIDERFVPVNFTMTLAISQHRHVQATTSYYPMPGTSPDPILDRMSASLERQRNKVIIEDLKEEIAGREKALVNMKAKLDRLDADNDVEIEKLRGEREERHNAYKNSEQKLREETERTGSRTFDAEKPGVKSKLEPLAKATLEIDDKIVSMKAEREKGHKEYERNVADFNEAIAEKRAEIARLEALVG